MGVGMEGGRTSVMKKSNASGQMGMSKIEGGKVLSVVSSSRRVSNEDGLLPQGEMLATVDVVRKK
jgi:hypothetical protein